MKERRRIAGVPLLQLAFFGMALASGASTLLLGQEVPADPATPTGPPVTVRGVVVNASTGQPLRRALVKVSTGEELGALTDNEGRFEIYGVPQGVVNLVAMKPGYEELMAPEDLTGLHRTMLGAHVVRVASDMPELSFSLAPKNAIFGHLTLSTGTPALGIGLTLLRQRIVDGRAGWVEADRHETTPDGAFRFAGLPDGTYLLTTQPEFDNDHASALSCSADAPAEMSGYAPVFYGDAHEMAGAARIVVVGGQSAEVNLGLTLTKFHLVEATLARVPAGGNWEFSNMLLNSSGQELEFPVHEEKNHSLCVYLPDGSYMLAVGASRDGGAQPRGDVGPQSGASTGELKGLLEFSVEGQAARSLRVPLAQAVSTPIHLRYEPRPPAPEKAGRPSGEEVEEEGADLVEISATRASAVSGKVDAEATEASETTYELETVSPGAYWIHADASRKGVCIGTASAAGQNLARSTWTAGASGVGAPIDLVLRTDCANLTVQMPATLPAESSGEAATWYIYAVPEFDSIASLPNGQIEQFSDRTATLEDMTPGSYRVFAFRAQQSIEFRNPAALDRLGPGQEVTLEPGSSANLVLEAVSR